MSEASERTPYSSEYLSLRARQGKLQVRKIDNVWYTTERALSEYASLQKDRAEHSQKRDLNKPLPKAFSSASKQKENFDAENLASVISDLVIEKLKSSEKDPVHKKPEEIQKTDSEHFDISKYENPKINFAGAGKSLALAFAFILLVSLGSQAKNHSGDFHASAISAVDLLGESYETVSRGVEVVKTILLEEINATFPDGLADPDENASLTEEPS